MRLARPLAIVFGLLVVWKLLVLVTGVESFILPAPDRVLLVWWENFGIIMPHALTTLTEILLGLLFGTVLGAVAALLIDYFAVARRWLMPLLVISQAIPVFAIAPLLVIWFGFGMASKIVMTVLIIFFPVTASFVDGLRRTDPGWLELAQTMLSGLGERRRRWALLRQVRLPAALPALASGLRVATSVAPIGAVVGEWVGASSGLGFLMLHANARMQIDLMFAALLTLSIMAVTLFYIVDYLLRRLIPWQSEKFLQEERSKS